MFPRFLPKLAVVATIVVTSIWVPAPSDAAPVTSTTAAYCPSSPRLKALAGNLCAQPGDIIDVRIGDVHPTQPSLGYDEVYYKLGRYTLGKDAVNKKFSDWCEVSGLVEATAAKPNARLDDPSSFTCTLRPGQETADSKAAMKTVVIGPKGTLWLTDGHHTLTSFYEMADGGANAHVRLRVAGNLSNLHGKSFWKKMVDNKWVWLSDVSGRQIKQQDLPNTVGLKNFADDKYRSLMYFARDVAYTTDGAIPFQEFYWGAWLRDARPDLSTWNRTDASDYLDQVKKTGEAITALPGADVVHDGFTKTQLGGFDKLNTKEFAKLSKPYSDSKPGKIAYMIEFKRAHGLK